MIGYASKVIHFKSLMMIMIYTAVNTLINLFFGDHHAFMKRTIPCCFRHGIEGSPESPEEASGPKWVTGKRRPGRRRCCSYSASVTVTQRQHREQKPVHQPSDRRQADTEDRRRPMQQPPLDGRPWPLRRSTTASGPSEPEDRQQRLLGPQLLPPQPLPASSTRIPAGICGVVETLPSSLVDAISLFGFETRPLIMNNKTSVN